MDIRSNWNEIKSHFDRSFKTNFHVSIASVDENNNPTVTPIGSLFIRNNQTGFYFEKYPTKLPINAEINKNICVLAINSDTWFWLKSLFAGEFKSYPAIKLYGELGEKRKATDVEIKRLNGRMKSTKGFKGNKYLWGKMEYVRDISFIKAEKIILGKMTNDLK
jgi:hypothetical protein